MSITEVDVGGEALPGESGLPEFDVGEIERRLAAGRNLPTQCYLDEAVHHFELDAVFGDAWQYFAPVHHLRAIGSRVVGTVGRTPVVVIRNDDGQLRGFVNACRHRGYRLVDCSASEAKSRLQCSYHGWVYRLDGSLAAVGRGETDKSLVKDALGLLPVSVDVLGQGIFVNPKPDAGKLVDAFPGIDRVALDIGLDPDLNRYRPVARYSVEQKSNWKLWYDNGTECYHCPTVHGASFGAAFDTTEGVYSFNIHGAYSSGYFESTRNSGVELVGGDFRSLQLFPGTQYIQHNDLMVMGRVVPTGPGSCRFEADYLAEDGADPDRVEQWVKLWNQTYDEDAVVVERIQQNLASGRIDELIYVDGMEDVSRHYHGLIWKAYRRHLGG